MKHIDLRSQDTEREEKGENTSPLESITGIGPKRRRDLLRYFGGWQEIERASIDDLAKVDGNSQSLQKIFITSFIHTKTNNEKTHLIEFI